MTGNIHVAMCTYIHIHLKSIGGVSLRLGGRKMEGIEEAVSEAHIQGSTIDNTYQPSFSQVHLP